MLSREVGGVVATPKVEPHSTAQMVPHVNRVMGLFHGGEKGLVLLTSHSLTSPSLETHPWTSQPPLENINIHIEYLVYKNSHD